MQRAIGDNGAQFSGSTFSFAFPCFVLPEDAAGFLAAAASRDAAAARAGMPTLAASTSWIFKPPKGGAGKGIFVVDGASEARAVLARLNRKAAAAAQGSPDADTKKKKPRAMLVAQPLLPNPHLIDGKKWDLRTYVLVTSTVPLRAYVYDRGLVRFAGTAHNATAARGPFALCRTRHSRRKDVCCCTPTISHHGLDAHSVARLPRIAPHDMTQAAAATSS